MRIECVIKPTGAQSEFTKEAWCRLIDRRPELRRPEPRQGINPFNGERLIIPPRPDAAEVVIDGISVGSASWSTAKRKRQIQVSINGSAIPLAREWATELAGFLEF